MGKFVTPKVFMVGATAIDVEGINDYLHYTSNEEFLESMNEANRAGVSEGEVLCSAFAKLCYKSLTLGQNLNVTRVRDIPENIKACVAQGHGSVFEHCQLNFIATDCSRVFCYHPETEVYTSTGWKWVTDLRESDEILTFNQESKMARWSPILSTHSFPYEGEMYAWSNSQMLSPMMTPDHTLWMAWYDLRRARGLSASENVCKYGEKVPVSEAFGKQFVVRKDIPWHENGIGETIHVGKYEYETVSLFSWLGWMSTDGGFSKDRPSKTTITQSKPNQIAKIRTLMDSLFSCRWKMHGPYNPTGVIAFTVYDADLAEFARVHLGPNKSERIFSKWLLDAGVVNLRAFLEASIEGDGSIHKDNGHRCLYVPSIIAAGQYQIIGAILGTPANLRIDDRTGQSHELDGESVTATKPCYIVDFSRRGGGTLIKKEYQFQQWYSGLVYCPKTEDGVIFVRRTGHPFWCGNTHELVRHRVGTAFSQTSGRYVRGDSVDIVFDPILEPIRHVAEELQYEIEVQYKFMVELMKLDEMKDFAMKKKITSALRRFLPNGQSNEIAFSLNLRSLRHLIQMRTGEGAEWEIRFIFNQVYHLVKDRYRYIFCDAKEREVDGLLEVYGMKMNPYETVAV